MAIGKINGPMLQPNLERQGINIALDGTLMYWDVNNRYVGINNTTPGFPLDVTGNAHIGNIYIKGNTISTESAYRLNLGSISNIVVTGGALNNVLYTDGAGNLAFASLVSVVANSGFTGNNIAIGTPTQGSMSNAITIGSTYTIADSIALLNQNVGNVTANLASTMSKIYSNANAASYFTTYSGNISATTFTGNLVGGVTGNVAGNINGTSATFTNATITNITGTLQTAAQPNVTSVGTLTSVAVAGNATVGNAVTTGSYFGNVIADTITPYQTGVINFTNTSAIKLPTGGTPARPVTPVTGYFRYNSDLVTLEFYNGSAWIPFTNQIIDQQITPDGVSNSFTLSQTATATGLIVSINGTLQRPGSAYTVTGTTITFSEIPSATDVIDVRFIGSPGTTTMDYNLVDVGNVAVGTSNVIVDSFSTTLYRSAEYVISSSNNTDTSMLSVLLAQNGTVAAINTTGNVNTGTNYLTFYANIVGSTVNLIAKGTGPSNQLRIQRTYFNV